MNIDWSRVVPIAQMCGDDEEDTALLRQMYQEALSFMRSFKWCRDVTETLFGLGIGRVVAVFLCRIDADENVDEWLWVVVGDLPPAYLVTDEAPTPAAALDVYCDLMSDWVSAVKDDRPVDDVYPISAAPTQENAELLRKRIEFLRKEIIPAWT